MPVPDEVVAQSRTLLSRYDSLASFEDVARWDTAAQALIGRIRESIGQLEGHLGSLSEAEQAEQAEHRARPWYSRWFGWRAERRVLRRAAAGTRSSIRKLSSIADEFEERIASTPDDADDLSVLVDDLKLRKKELQLDLKEVKSHLRDARADARTKRANIGLAHTKFGRSMNRASRMDIRLELESKLQRGETQVQALERQVASIERKLNWLHRFKVAAKRRRGD